MRNIAILAALTMLTMTSLAHAAVLTYGDQDLDGFGYPSGVDPTAGATLQGLAPDVVTLSSTAYFHAFPFAPSLGDYPGTDQIYVGQTQTATHDGYSNAPQRLNGPQIITLDYSALVPAGQTISTLTLGLGADDFQTPAFGNPFIASINGIPNAALSTALMSLNQTGPFEQFLSIGIDPAILASNQILTLSIDEGGDGGDGWSLDFLTVGVATVPEPASLLLLSASLPLLFRRRRA